jgi:Flp pilus assembly protein TadG
MIDWKTRIRDRRGATLVLVAFSMVALLSVAALAIDVGNLLVARTESQRAGEAGALYGAAWLMTDPDGEAVARTRAIEAAQNNTIRGAQAVVLPEDVEVDLTDAIVRVHVRNVVERGNAIGTFFARIFGVDSVNVSTISAAWAAPRSSVVEGTEDCLLPIALLDRWADDGDGTYESGEIYDRETTGFDDEDIGTLIVAKTSGSQNLGPPYCRTESELVDIDACRDEPESDSWRCWYRESEPSDGGGGGTSVLGPRIYPGTQCGPDLAVGDPVYEASGGGNKQDLVKSVNEDFGGSCSDQTVCDPVDPTNCWTETVCSYGDGSFADLIRADPDIHWDDNLGCPVRVSNPTADDCVQESPRIRRVPLVSPEGVFGTGSGVSSTISDFTGVFVDMVSCNYDAGMFAGPEGNWNVYLRIMRAPTTATSGDNEEDPGTTTLKELRLIE